MFFHELIKAPVAHDWYYTIGAIFLIVFIISLSEAFKKRFNWHEELTRKIVHIFVGILAFLAPLFFTSPLLPLLISIIFAIIDFIAVKKGLLKSIHGNRFSYGTVYFPLAYIILILIYWTINKYLISVGIILFAIPDALSSIIGQKIKSSHNFIFIRDKKSIEGSIVMFISSIFILTGCFWLFKIEFHSMTSTWILSIALGFIVTIVEMLSSKGSDNLFVPLSGAIATHVFIIASPEQVEQIFFAIILALVIAILSYYIKFLTPSGSAMTFLLATAIFGLGGLKWTVPILTFFILSSILSKTGKGAKEKFKDTFEKSGVRDYAQVLVNGGIGGILVIINYFYTNDQFYFLYLLSLAVSTSDTWATEIGVYLKPKPRLITNFKKVEPGVSGAISLHGSFGALVGSFILISSGFIFLTPWELNLFITLVLLGFTGSMIDSLMGATIQGQYNCRICQKYTEKAVHCGQPAIHKSGYRAINNDAVNLYSNLLILIFYCSFFI